MLDGEYLRRRAGEVQGRADLASDPTMRSELLALAGEYEMLAVTAKKLGALVSRPFSYTEASWLEPARAVMSTFRGAAHWDALAMTAAEKAFTARARESRTSLLAIMRSFKLLAEQERNIRANPWLAPYVGVREPVAPV